MNDPYQVLNVSPQASDEEIKKAYRELARKYHPDNYHNNPLADLAQEKMKEINEAYDAILKMRAGGGGEQRQRSRGPSGQNSYGGAAYDTPPNSAFYYQTVRSCINTGDLVRAEQMLQSAPARDAEWNFLMGSLAYRKGWMDEAQRYFETACSMNPGNPEYRQALNYMQSGGRAYRPMGGMGGGMSGCDFCGTMICADCCCESMGGDLIPCC